MRKVLLCGSLCLALLAVAKHRGDLQADPKTETSKAAAPEETLKPRWQVGQRWIVETTSTPVQTGDAETPVPGKPVKWQFKVAKREKVAGRDCFRVEITCQSNEDAPKTTIWVDEKSLALRQVEAGMLVQGEVRMVKERYEFEKGSPSPVVGPLSALPLDLPLFSTVRPRSGKYGYKTIALDAEDKVSDDVPFTVEVEQQLTPANAAVARGLLREDDKRDSKVSTYEVRLKSPEREVRQLWRPGMPWPSYSSNGSTTARLIKVLPPTGGR
jgi:hypothetical protein